MRRRAGLLAGSLLAVVAVPAGAAPYPCTDLPPAELRCEVWSREIHDTAPHQTTIYDAPAGLVASADGRRLYAAATTSVDYGRAYQTVVALDAATGATRWAVRSPTGPEVATARAIVLTPDQSRVVVVGTVGPAVSVVAYAAASGRVLWRASVRGGERSSPAGVVVGPRGDRVFVAVNQELGDMRIRTFVVALDARTGQRRWARDHAGQATAAAVAPGGDVVYVAGPMSRPGSRRQHDVGIAAFDARTGRVRWSRATRIGFTAIPMGIAVSGRGDRVVVTGVTEAADTPKAPAYAYLTASYDASGGQLRWTAQEHGDPGQSAVPAAIATVGDRVYVTGVAGRVVASHPAVGTVPSQQYMTVGYDGRTGHRAWRREYAPGGLRAAATALAVDQVTGRVYAAGFVAGAPSEAVRLPTISYLGVVAYDPDGTKAWAAQWGAREPDAYGVTMPVAATVPRVGGRVFVSAYHEALAGLGTVNETLEANGAQGAPPVCEAAAATPYRCRDLDPHALLVAYPA